MRKPDTTRPRSESRRFAIPFLGILLGLIFSWGGDAFARQDGKDQRIRAEVNLVVLHATVIDDRGRFVPDLKEANFRVFEDKVEQKLSLFKREEIGRASCRERV